MNKWIVATMVSYAVSSWAIESGSADGSGQNIHEDALRLMEKQETVVQIADQITAFLHRVRGSEDAPVDNRYDGFSGIELDVEKLTVSLFWKEPGRAPIELVEMLKDLRRASSVQVKLLPASFSALELRRETRALVQAMTEQGIKWSTVGPNQGGTGLRLSVAPGSAERGEARLIHDQVTKVNQRLRSMASVFSPLDGAFVEVEEAPAPQLTSRQNDSPPWWGGAEIVGLSSGRCSSGFAIGNIWGKAMLSAGHCFQLVNGIGVTDGAGDFMGTSVANGLWNLGGNDTARIEVSSVQGRIYFGGVAGSETSKAVKGSGTSYIGLWLCTSGAFSGSRCHIMVDLTEQTILAGAYVLEHQVRGTEPSGTNAGGTGDSGGPVFSLRDANVNVTAQGTLSASSTSLPVPCTGIISVNGQARFCSNQIFYFPIGRALNHHGMWIETN